MGLHPHDVPLLLFFLFVVGNSDARIVWSYHQSTSGGAMPSPVPADCLRCLCMALSTSCQMPQPVCKFILTSRCCGPYNVIEKYWNDARLLAGDLQGSWASCSSDMECSQNTVQGYMALYAAPSRLGHTPTCEDFARIHYGGPYGYRIPSTLGYWLRVKECLDL